MATAQNGWPVVEAAACDETPIGPGIHCPNGFLAGDVWVIFNWLAWEYHRRVEPLVDGTCWGYDKKTIGSGSTWSNHAAGCAGDFNADQHNDGDPPSRSMSQAQIDQCHAIERDSGGVLRWGGDWSDPDAMHWEIVGSKSEVAAFAAKIESEGFGMFLPKEGDQGEEVKFWQYLLEDCGQELGNVDGVFGPKTVAAVNADRTARGQGAWTNPCRITGWHARALMKDALSG